MISSQQGKVQEQKDYSGQRQDEDVSTVEPDQGYPGDVLTTIENIDQEITQNWNIPKYFYVRNSFPVRILIPRHQPARKDEVKAKKEEDRTYNPVQFLWLSIRSLDKALEDMNDN